MTQPQADPAAAAATQTRSFWRNVVLLAGGTGLAQAVTLGVTPLLTRLYTPDDFGAFAVYFSVLLIGIAIASLRFEFAIPLPGSHRTAAALLVLALLGVCGVAGLSAVAVVALGGTFVDLTDAAALEPYLWLIPVGILGGGAYQALTYWSIRQRAFGRIARTRVTQSVAMAGTQLAMGVAGASVVGLVVGAALGQVVGAGRLAGAAWRDAHAALVRIDAGALRRAAGRYRRFPQLSTPSGLINSVGIYAPAIVLAGFYGPAVAGWFALTQRALNAPLALLSNAVGQTYTGEAAWRARTDAGTLRELFDSTLKRLALAALAPAVLAAVLSPTLFDVAFGSDWRPSGEFVQVLAGMFFLQFVALPLSQSLNILERLGLQLAYDILRLVLGLGALTVAFIAGAGALGAVAAYGGGMTVAYVLNIAVNRFAITRTARCRS